MLRDLQHVSLLSLHPFKPLISTLLYVHRIEFSEEANHPQTMLLCDGCDLAYHLACLQLSSTPRGDWYCPDCLACETEGDTWLRRKRLHRVSSWLGAFDLAFTVGAFVGVYWPSKHAELYVAQVVSIDIECGIALQNWSLWKDRPDRERYVYLEDAAGEDWVEPQRYWRLILPLKGFDLGEMQGRRSLTLSLAGQERVHANLAGFSIR